MTATDLTALDYDRVLVNLAEGAPTLKRACAFDRAPRPFQVLERAKADPEFSARLDEAIASGADNIHDEIVQIESGVVLGWCSPAAASAALSSKRWRLERLDRKRWGAKVDVEHRGNVALGLTIHDRPKAASS